MVVSPCTFLSGGVGVFAGCVETRVHKQVPRGIGCAKPRRGPLWGRCVFSAVGEGDEGGAVCVCVCVREHAVFHLQSLMLPRTSPLIRQDPKAGMRGTHATHAHMTHVVSHTFITLAV